jgi:PKD repeat protein
MSYGNALADFDNDGDLDYIMGMGWGSGHIYISEKTGPGNQFADPQIAATWGEQGGFMPMDMAVADFDEDGLPDFVMAFMYGEATGLYLGDGALGFRSVTLPMTAPYLSAGVDAADFNNDGHADFVVAPYSDGPFFINLGNGDGTFTTSTFATVDGGALWGVAAADFDNDGAVDIAAAYFDYLYIYKGVKDAAGNVDGRTFQLFASYEYDMNQSPLDNYDFNGDGNQDLVAGNYGDTAGDAVFLGNGDGSFTYAGTYVGGVPATHRAVTVPPVQSQKANKAPTAVIEPTFLEVTAGEEIVFDGSNSYDEDGQIVNYEWDFGDADPVALVAGDKPSHTYYQAGTYTVTLTVTDDEGATNTVQAEVSVLPIAVTVKFSPHKLDQRRKHKWLKATISLPENLDAADLDLASLYIEIEGSNKRIYAAADSHHGFFAKCLHRIQRKMNVVKVKFDWRALIDTIETPSDNTVLTLHLKGTCGKEDKVEFQGDGTIQAQLRNQ